MTAAQSGNPASIERGRGKASCRTSGFRGLGPRPRAALLLLSDKPVLPLVAVSGAECVEALVLAGFTVRTRSDASTVLEREGRVVVVPDVAMLAPEDIESLLNDAGIPYESFLDLLSETPTDPAGIRPTSGIRRTPAGDGR